MSVFHNETVLAMPIYFLALGIVIFLKSLPLLYKKDVILNNIEMLKKVAPFSKKDKCLTLTIRNRSHYIIYKPSRK